MSILISSARVLTLDGPPIDDADVLVQDGIVKAIGPDLATDADDTIDADGRVLMPAFIDCHTHACWAGDRLDEWEMKQRGATYLEILERGGGIMSTVRDVRTASRRQLAETLLERLNRMLREGTTTCEVKSGYGLSTPATNSKMLEAIRLAAGQWPATLIPTACIGHALDPDVDHDTFIEMTISETLPAVSDAFPGIAIDAYCEQGAWSLDECLRLFDRAAELGHPLRVHADQFNSLAMIPAAIERGFRSVDHLEATTPDELAALANSDTFGVMLPCSGFHVDGRYGDGRAFLDHAGKLAIATNFNPGSAPCGSMPIAIALATRYLGLTADEAIAAATTTPAALLGLTDRAVIAPGKRADLVLLEHRDERQLAYEFGPAPVRSVICGGTLVASHA